MKSNKVHATRGEGLLENFLARKRAYIANSFIDENERSGAILDIGCGSYPLFLSATSFKERYGVDPLIRTKKDIGNISLIKFDVTKKKLPFKDEKFNCVTMLAVFEHIDNDKLEFVLKEARRVLRKGSRLIITTPAPWADRLLHTMARTKLISSEEIHEHKHHYSKSEIVEFISHANFKKSKIKSGYFELGFNMWFVATK